MGQAMTQHNSITRNANLNVVGSIALALSPFMLALLTVAAQHITTGAWLYAGMVTAIIALPTVAFYTHYRREYATNPMTYTATTTTPTYTVSVSDTLINKIKANVDAELQRDAMTLGAAFIVNGSTADSYGTLYVESCNVVASTHDTFTGSRRIGLPMCDAPSEVVITSSTQGIDPTLTDADTVLYVRMKNASYRVASAHDQRKGYRMYVKGLRGRYLPVDGMSGATGGMSGNSAPVRRRKAAAAK